MYSPSNYKPGLWQFRLTSLLCLLTLAVLLVQGCTRRETLVERGVREQVLHRGIGAELEDLDPQQAVQAADYHVLSALFEGLVAEDPVDLHPVPGVAERWESSSDGRVFTFHLRGDARWSDGTPVTAEDFVSSYKRALSPVLGAKAASALYVLRGAKAYHKGESTDFSTVGVQAPGSRTLRLTLEQPCAPFLAMLTQPVWWPVNVRAISACGPVDARGTAWTRPGKLVCNGPFTLAEWSVNHRIVVRKNPRYWDAAKVSLSQIHFYPMGVDTEERAFRAGQLHVTDALPPSKVNHYAQLSHSPLRMDPMLGTYFYRLNTRLPALADARVRKALTLATDRQAIITSVLRAGQAPAKAFTPAGIAGYVPPAGLEYNADEARRLLAEAGYPRGEGLPAIEILFNSSDTHRAVAETVQELWRTQLGVRVKLVNMEQTSVLAARRTGDFQALRSSWTADYADPASFLGIWTSESPDNFTGWADPAYDALLAEAARTIEASKRAELLAQAETRLIEAAPFIGIYHFTHIFLIHPAVKGWHPTLLDHHPYKHVRLEQAPAPGNGATQDKANAVKADGDRQRSREAPVVAAEHAQTLRISQLNEPGDLDPALAQLPDEYFVIRALGEGLVTPAPDGGTPLPAAARSWDISEDGLEYTFHLRPGATWSDGRPVTAEDFAWSLRRVLDPATPAQKADLLMGIAGATLLHRQGRIAEPGLGIHVLDTLTLRLRLARPDPAFLNYVASGPWIPVPRHVVERLGKDWTRPGNHVGNGPYVLQDWQPGRHISVRRRPEYWNAAETRIETLRFVAMDNKDAEERAFRAGQLDVTMSVPTSKIPSYAEAAPSLLRQSPLLETRYLSFNTRKPPLTDARVRRALAIAIDRTLLTKKVLLGEQEPALRMLPPALCAGLGPVSLTRDLNEARRLLADAGFPGGHGLPILELSGWTNLPVLETIQAMWRDTLGVQTSIALRDARTHVNAMQQGRYDIGLAASMPDVADPRLVLREFANESPNNYPGWTDDPYEQLLIQLDRTTAMDERVKLLTALEQRLAEECPLAPLYFNCRTYLVHPRVRGWSEDMLWNRFYCGPALAAP